MRISATHLRYAGLVIGLIAIVLAFAGLEQSAIASSRTNPEAAIALAIVAYVFVRASETQGK